MASWGLGVGLGLGGWGPVALWKLSRRLPLPFQIGGRSPGRRSATSCAAKRGSTCPPSTASNKTSTSRYGPETTGPRPNRGSCCTAAPRAPNDPDSKPAVDVLLAPTVAQRCSPAVDLERAETTNAPAERATKALVSAALSGWTCCDWSRPCIRLRIRRQRITTPARTGEARTKAATPLAAPVALLRATGPLFDAGRRHHSTPGRAAPDGLRSV